MALTQSIHPSSTLPAEHNVVHTTQLTLKILFTAVPIVAGLDKFTNLLANWETYLNPLALRIVPVSAATFMGIVGVIEIIAGILVFLKPRIGGLVVAAWLIAISLQLILWGRFLDVAVRDIVIALGGALTLARLTPFAAESARISQR
ncbi:hypothetical protein [Opitutus terrae]|uniref:tRNA (5-methylaminomethyl-2-thiouridylate)-methyltransferase n=1 Tax=Opitutus terrae (strain DSM 11246 / JCM 15787 / PB90-1) TaxID=452637 RepID=B1ZXI2_OPITP|nr:hypothetical protein [Opitutus terrae]ACB76977.1 hypothetical protein Oter_3702 [Opitutus terrae PB90-1]